MRHTNIWLVLCLCILTQNLLAKKLPVDIYADHVHYDNILQIGDYYGNVRIIQGKANIKAERVKSYMKNHRLAKLELFGHAKNLVSYDGHETDDKQRFLAKATKMIYYPDKHIVELHNQAKIAQGKNSFSADKIIYDISQKRVISEPDKNKRTVIEISSNTVKNIIEKGKNEHINS
jgi:lipopolysaccharide transport protein LptA